MWALVINPTSGGGKGATIGIYVAGFLSSRQIAHEIVSGNSSIALVNNLSKFLQKYPDCAGVIAVGGDGLTHNILALTTPAQIPLAVVPAGTGNDFVRTLGWSLLDLDPYLESIISMPALPIDLGLVNGQWFAAVLSTGFDSIVNEKANTLAWPKGAMKYNVAIAIELPRFKPRHYEITLDNQQITTQAMLIAIANGRSYGGGMLVCPDADLHDGYFDVMLLHPVSKVEFLKVFPRVFKGEHVTHPAVEIIRSKNVQITADAIAYADGERIGPLPMSAECIPNAMHTWIP
ncbi:MAG: YegS/Rv2252/BmrU family lipid kinase [Actinomycetota bacterium]|nr:YegS/Rv2252/BmrU family lipid kinase [Actinomycetota bacterium]